MLEPREADIPALFLVLVVLPLVTYFLLGKWHEATKRKERLEILAQLAAEEARRAAAASIVEIPSGLSPKTGLHQCARCLSPATTRCSRCKSVRYCSGKCQIIHWRQGHKHECQQSDNRNSISSTNLTPVSSSATPRTSQIDNPSPTFFRNDIKEPMVDGVPSNISGRHSTTIIDKSKMFQVEQKLADKCARDDFKVDREISRSKIMSSFHNVEKTIGDGHTTRTVNMTGSTSFLPSKDASTEQKVLNSEFGPFRSTMRGTRKLKCQNDSGFEPVGPTGILDPHLERNGTSSFLDRHNSLREEGCSRNENPDLSSSNMEIPREKSSRSREYPCLQTERKVQTESPYKIPPTCGSVAIPVHRSTGIMKMGDVKMIGSRKLPRLARRAPIEDGSNSLKKNTVLFPYEEFIKLFHYEVLEFSPRGLLNCGNSCYANAVLQCLTYTKPLVIYLLRRSHSGTCWTRDWCLMCELEQHMSNLTVVGGPLSLRRILSNMQNIGCQMGGGSQEDAHEFLRLLVTSMQSICLEGLGGEKEIDIRLQETTFIQQTFGGCLRSKVKCLRCQHESERYENIMDLTLEILGWVETLEDALTQFTAPEDLDGENMYRCGRCTSYVKARKQLSIHEAPNILTIVLKRFQSGKYGKINKCITFPDLLDMIPFMTGTGDSPPLYMLYAVVVHLDTSNASFSGHYVSYVKDMQGTWFRIDDTEVEPVPLSQVMSEGAYILFYSRSFPRPPKVHSRRPTTSQSPASAKSFTPITQKSSRQKQCKPYNTHSASELSSRISSTRIGSDPDVQSTKNDQFLRISNRNILSTKEIFSEFSDFTSSDGSLFTSDGSRFTSSDEASFTTESNRDSISTVDYADSVTLDPVSSIFSTYYIPEYSHSNLSCTKFLPCRPQTIFFFEGRDFVLDSSMSGKPLGSVHKGSNPKQVSAPLREPLASANNCGMFVR